MAQQESLKRPQDYLHSESGEKELMELPEDETAAKKAFLKSDEESQQAPEPRSASQFTEAGTRLNPHQRNGMRCWRRWRRK
jgi:hypothetical protein